MCVSAAPAWRRCHRALINWISAEELSVGQAGIGCCCCCWCWRPLLLLSSVLTRSVHPMVYARRSRAPASCGPRFCFHSDVPDRQPGHLTDRTNERLANGATLCLTYRSARCSSATSAAVASSYRVRNESITIRHALRGALNYDILAGIGCTVMQFWQVAAAETKQTQTYSQIDVYMPVRRQRELAYS